MKALAIAALLGAAASATPAEAALLQFTLTGDYNASFQIDSSPTPDAFQVGTGFVLFDVEGNFPGSLFDLADLTFYNSSIGGGLEIYDFYDDTTLLLTDGAQLYTGSESAPTFRLGSFALTEFGGTGTYNLSIAAVGDAAVPEPATWAMMLAGFGIVGAGMRSRRRSTTVTYA